MKKSLALILSMVLVLSAVILPESAVFAKTKCWYTKYCEYKSIAKKAAVIKGSKLYLKNKWEHTSSRYGSAKAKKINKTFKLNSKTRYYIEDTSAETMKKVSKKKFKKNMYNDVSSLAFKVKSGKVIKAIVSLN